MNKPHLGPLYSFLRAGLIVLLTIASSGCDQLSNNANEVALLCGSDFVPGETGRYIKFQPPDDAQMDITLLSSLKSVSLTHGEAKPLQVSSRGCVALEGEEILARGIYLGQSVSAVLRVETKTNILSSKFEVKLLPLTSPKITLQCGATGIFGGTSAIIPINIITQDIAKLSYELIARSVTSKTPFSIWKKGFASLESAPSSFDISRLVPGQYELEIHLSNLSNSLYENLEFFHLDQSCSLYKLEMLGELSQTSIPNIKAVGADLGLPPTRGLEYRSCKEPINSFFVSNPNQVDCNPKSTCANEDSYSQSSKIVADEPGFFRYFYYGIDEAGQRSKTSCKDFIISEKAPEIQVRWKDAALNKPNAVLASLKTVISADISTSHGLLSGSDVHPLCKAHFLLATGETISASSVKCLSEQCKGMDLSSFVPCKDEIQLDFKSVYSRTELSKSIFVLTTEATDGAGHKNQDHTSFWIDRSKIKKVTLAPNASIENYDRKFLSGKRPGELIDLLRNDNGEKKSWLMRSYSSGTLTTHDKFDKIFDNLRFTFRDGQGELYSIWSGLEKDEEGSPIENCIFTTLEGSTLSRIDSEKDPNCKNDDFWPDVAKGFWQQTLYEDNRNELRYFNGKAWIDYTIPGSAFLNDVSCNITWATKISEELFVRCGDALYVSKINELNFQKIINIEGAADFSIDAYEQIWIVQKFANQRFGYISHHRYIDLSSTLKDRDFGRNLVSITHGQFTLGDLAWNNVEKSFTDPLFSKFPNIGSTGGADPLSCSSKGVTTFGAEGTVFWPLAELLSDTSEWPVDCRLIYANGNELVLGTHRGSLISFKNEDWILLGDSQYPYANLGKIKSVKTFKDHVTVVHLNGEVMQLIDNTWKKFFYTLPPEYLQEENHDIQIFASKYLGLAQGDKFWVSEDGKEWTEKVSGLPFLNMLLPNYIQIASDGTFFWYYLNKMFSNRGGNIKEEPGPEQVPANSGVECKGAVWLFTQLKSTDEKGISISRYDPISRNTEYFEIDKISLGESALRMQCVDSDRVILKTIDARTNDTIDYVYSRLDKSRTKIGPSSKRSFLSDYSWIKDRSRFVRDELVFDEAFKPANSSGLIGITDTVKDWAPFSYVDETDGLWYYTENEIIRLNLSK